MSKRFKLKFSNVLPSSLQICRSKEVAISPEKLPRRPVYGLAPVNTKTLDIAYPSPTPPPASQENSHIRRQHRHLPSKITDCSSGSSSSPDYPSWVREASKWRVLAGARGGDGKMFFDTSRSFDSSCDMSPFCICKKQKENKKIMKASVLSGNCTRCYSGEDEEEEEEALICSSQRFSMDSSYDFDQSIDSTTEIWSVSNVKKLKKLRRYASRSFKGITSKSKSKSSKTVVAASPEIEFPVRASVLRGMLPCAVDGKVRESIAVVKKSKDPYEDFKRSMLEMILEKQMFDANDLEQLLQCFLTLNSTQYHGVIVGAFTEIWEILFCDSSSVMRPVAAAS